MNYYDLELNNVVDNIKMYKHAIKLYRGVLYFTLIFTASQVYSAIHNPNYITWTCIGAFIANILWFAGDLHLAKCDLKLEKERFNLIKNHRNDELAKGLSKQFQSAKEQYERLHSKT